MTEPRHDRARGERALRPLPIDAELPAIVEAVRRGPGLVLVAEPGAGKTTRVPRALLLAGLAERGEIVVLEPRRIATRMAARRVAEELGEPVGERIGYAVRFEDVSSARTRVRFVTEGILARRLADDPELRGVAVVVIDELHERSIHADLALALVRRLQRESRPDLRIVAMSATLEAEKVAAFLEAPVLRVSGRAHDVAIEHATEKDDRPLEVRVAAAVRRALRDENDGHVLVFLPGAAEIRRAEEALASLTARGEARVLPLHGDLPAAEQDRAVASSTERKVILSTNVAETSLTIDGVVAVVDSGLHRLARHSPWSGMPELSTAPISRSSATQRAGRAGRTRAGRAIRLYTRLNHDARPAHDPPEIERADLADTVLLLARTGVPDARAFPFFERPPDAALAAAIELVRRLGATDTTGALTPLGRTMSALPLHPRLARLGIEAARHGVPERGALVAALLSERDVVVAARTRFGERALAVETGTSDVLDRLERLEALDEGGGAGAARTHGLDVGAARAALRSRSVIARALSRLPRSVLAMDTSPAGDADEAILRAVLVAFPDRVGKRRKRNAPEIVLSGGGSARLADTSVVRDAELVVCVEARTQRGGVECSLASAIEAEWLLELFADRVQDVREIRFDRDKERIEAVTALAYDGLFIDESRRDAAGMPGAAAVLARAARDAGLGRFVDLEELEQLRRRLTIARKTDASIPVLDDTAVDRALVELSDGRRSLAELEKAGLFDLIRAQLGDATLRALDRLAPTHVTLPGRARVPVTYEHDRPPWIESRMQDFFGLTEGPRAGGEPIVLHLMAPNMRAVQVTTDLGGFWDRHYPRERKELQRLYPRHRWPDDPRTAEAGPPPRRR